MQHLTRCRWPSPWLVIWLMIWLAPAAATAAQAAPAAALAPCRVPGVAHAMLCGSVETALDPGQPQGVRIAVHYAVAPALARNKRPDPVFVLAGGPGQSARDIAGAVLAGLGRLNLQRDLVFVDQRGTGLSAPLQCPQEGNLPLAQALDPAAQVQRLRDCLRRLQDLPYGDLRHFSTAHAIADFEAVRRQLGAPRVNLIGVSYGTRVALEYLRRYPQAVRRSVLDGVAPPDMALPQAAAADSRAALEQVFAACAAEAACARQYPSLRADWQALLATLPVEVAVDDPRSGQVQSLRLSVDSLERAVRMALYVPAFAAALPQALQAANAGNFTPLLGLGAALQSGQRQPLALGMHFSVVCSEDLPHPDRTGSAATAKGAEGSELRWYREVCGFWPRGPVPEGFYAVGPVASPVLLLSGGADPATPPHHGARVAAALGPLAQHVVVAQAGHGLWSLGCLRDVLVRFIQAETDALALPVDAHCAERIPRPTAFLPVAPVAGGAR